MFIKQVSIFQINKKNRSSASRPVEFKSAKEVLEEIRHWPKRNRKHAYPGTRQRSDLPYPPKVKFQGAVVQTITFAVARNRVGWLLPCENHTFLFVKPFSGKKMGLAAWVGGDRGFGPEVIAESYDQAIDALPASDHSPLQLRSSSGRRITRLRGWEGDVYPDTNLEEDEELETNLDTTGPYRLRRLTRNNHREQECSPSKSPMPDHARERHAPLATAVTAGEDLTVTPGDNLVASAA
ncbi:hypothetical protein MMC14_006439 [Varicellaria rhodocarpa]|nr:hypothetical protein [Varicellaria rhodocarpa]